MTTSAEVRQIAADMREGAALLPKCRGSYARTMDEYKVVAACAIGSVGYARALRDGDTRYRRVVSSAIDARNQIDGLAVPHGARLRVYGADVLHTVLQMVLLLNDRTGWTRRRIADWLDEVANAMDAEAAKL